MKKYNVYQKRKKDGKWIKTNRKPMDKKNALECGFDAKEI